MPEAMRLSPTDPVVAEGSAPSRLLELIAAEGPVTAVELATRLGVTSAAVRRHLGSLECDGLVAVHDMGPVARSRGRPARHYITTPRGQSELSGGYSQIAVQALDFLRHAVGTDAVEKFAESRSAQEWSRYAARVTGDDIETRAHELAAVLTADGYASSVRPVPGTQAIQLCQGHCPVQHVAREFPELCDAETRTLSQILGLHVQRLSTIAAGGHACTTNIPLAVRPAMARDDHPTRITDKD